MDRISIIICIGLLALTGCEREQRDFLASAPAEKTASAAAEKFERNAYHLSEGKRLFGWFNCVGCHANGGGGSGPALMDGKWLYGGSLEAIAASIREGRPKGMPAFKRRVPEVQIWQLAAYVRSLSGNASKNAAPGRNDDLHPRPAENRLETLPPENAGPTQ